MVRVLLVLLMIPRLPHFVIKHGLFLVKVILQIYPSKVDCLSLHFLLPVGFVRYAELLLSSSSSSDQAGLHLRPCLRKGVCYSGLGMTVQVRLFPSPKSFLPSDVVDCHISRGPVESVMIL